MYERSTNSSQQEKAETIHTPTKAADHKGMGTDRRRCDGSPKSSDSSQYPLSLAQTIRARCRDLSQKETFSRNNIIHKTPCETPCFCQHNLISPIPHCLYPDHLFLRLQIYLGIIQHTDSDGTSRSVTGT